MKFKMAAVSEENSNQQVIQFRTSRIPTHSRYTTIMARRGTGFGSHAERGGELQAHVYAHYHKSMLSGVRNITTKPNNIQVSFIALFPNCPLKRGAGRP